ncbi:MAG: hypothetical protein WD894_09365 [Pirellulales bacterium]
MNRLVWLACAMVLLPVSAKGEVVDLLFRPIDTALRANLQRSIHFRPIRDIELTGLGLIFDPDTTILGLDLTLWQQPAASDDLLGTLTPRLGFDFSDLGLNRYVFKFPESLILEQGRTYTYLADTSFGHGEWPTQFAETQQAPFMTISGSLTVLGAGHSATQGPPSAEHPPLLVEIVTDPVESVWDADGNGNWSSTENWRGGTPNGSSTTAIFGGAITQPRVVSVNVPMTVGRMDLNNAHGYTIAGPGSLTIATTDGPAEINVVKGNHTIGASLTLSADTIVTVARRDIDPPNAGTLSLTGMAASTGTLVKEGAGTLTINNVRASGLSVNWGAVTVAPNGTPAGTSVVRALTINERAKLDLTDNGAVIDYTGASPVATIRQQIRNGRGGPGLGKTWNGQGITSSAAAAADPESRSVAYAENSSLPLGPYTSFRGQPVDGTAVLITYTRTGDANLDGVVNDNDVTIVGATYLPGVPQPHWALGDFDYDGFIDEDDVTLLGVFYDPSAVPESQALTVGTATAVPEPASLLMLLLALTAALPWSAKWTSGKALRTRP